MGRKRPGDILRALRPKFDEVRERARGLSRTSQVALAGAGLSALAIAAIAASAALRQTNRSNRSMQEMSTVELLGLYDKALPQSTGPQSKTETGQGTENEGAEPALTKDGIARFCVSRVHELRDLVEQGSSALAPVARTLRADRVPECLE